MAVNILVTLKEALMQGGRGLLYFFSQALAHNRSVTFSGQEAAGK